MPAAPSGSGAVAPRPPLTPTQLRVLAFIGGRFADTAGWPTIREVGAELGIASPNGVICHVTALRRKGYLAPDGGSRKSRSLVIPALADAALAAAAAVLEQLVLSAESQLLPDRR